ncbi:hypothetical protein [Pelagicoccus mobilis]|uniref:Uncharacterized protein n=1 Tax=Pelagicoccus mobilis TaxID=415221 RepID=A0A934RT52_9BACT|nr:hypothetical protein [Pelagicoccus mobilis]MBK1876392.1 hypothetical protein [Pelagicoccus mobilis]
MTVDFQKPGGFASLTTTTPKTDSIPLGKVLRGLSERLDTETPVSIDETLDLFLEEHERYANATRIASLSSPHALKSWAAERLPAMGISYGFSNRINEQEVQANLDERAPLKLVEFADELCLLASYCRDVVDLKIEASPHSAGLAFQFVFHGKLKAEERALIEDVSVQCLLNEGSRDNCLRKRVFATEDRIEAECIALRKKMRLGFSPVF